jgi:signal transduction histidine kinase/ActR/RegA family two-component response regulator
MDATDEAWQRRIRELYEHVEELYSHVDITVVAFDRDLVEVKASNELLASPLGPRLADIARRILDTNEAQRDIALDQIGRQRVHAFPLHDQASIAGVVCFVVDDGARRELFVRCAMAIFDGYRQNEAALLERERKALDEARSANRQRDQFVAVVAHELHSPMTSILLWESVLRDPTIDSATRTAALDAIHEGATGQALLVADLLDVVRAMNGKLHIERSFTRLTRVLMMAIEDARQRAKTSQVEVVAELDPELGDVVGDSRRLRQVFDNLLSNALKCTDEGRVRVVARQNDETITIDVCDTGRGIAPAFLSHVFEPFRQADEHGAGAGLGLGLGIARQLVELHGGTLSASSDGLGRGAQFTVTIPRARNPGTNDSSARSSITGVRVLVIDDDARIVEGLQVLLQAAGAIVTTARSAAAGYGILEHEAIDILLSDVGMPGEDGFSLVQRIRATPGVMQRIPAIAITALVTADGRERVLAAGFDRYLPKPVDVPFLISTIAALVSQT